LGVALKLSAGAEDIERRIGAESGRNILEKFAKEYCEVVWRLRVAETG